MIPHESLRGLNIGKSIKMINIPEQKRVKFWDQLRIEFFTDGEKNDDS